MSAIAIPTELPTGRSRLAALLEHFACIKDPRDVCQLADHAHTRRTTLCASNDRQHRISRSKERQFGPERDQH